MIERRIEQTLITKDQCEEKKRPFRVLKKVPKFISLEENIGDCINRMLGGEREFH